MAKTNYEYLKAWHKRNPGKKKEYSDRYDKKNSAKIIARYQAKRAELAGRPKPSVCEVCRGNHHKGIVFDHCHKTGKFRGWICDRCNKTLGLVYDSPKLLRKLAKYLEDNDVEANIERKKQLANELFRWSGQELPD